MHHMKTLAWSLMLTGSLAFGFAACGGEEDNNASSSSSSCSGDNDCKGDRVCTAGACVDPSGGGGGGGTTDMGGGGGGGGGTTDMGGGGGGGGGTDATCAQTCTKVNSCEPSITVSDCMTGCEQNITQAQRNCVTNASTCPDADACVSTGGGGGGGEKGAIGATCDDNDDCDSQFCRKPAGAFDGKCAVNDFGNMCKDNTDCEYGACLYRNIDTDVFGYCTTTCSNFTDCPTFWSCKEVGNAGGDYCVNN